MNTQIYTYQTKLPVNEDMGNFLLDFSAVMNTVERKLFARLQTDNVLLKELKREFIRRYAISARQFNSIYSILLGKIRSNKALRSLHIDETKHRIHSIEAYAKHKRAAYYSPKAKKISISA